MTNIGWGSGLGSGLIYRSGEGFQGEKWTVVYVFLRGPAFRRGVCCVVGGAEAVIDLIQGTKTILWSSLTGTVTNIRTVGWPTDDGTHQLGGALTLVRPTDGDVGIVNFGEKPMSMTFNIED